MRTTCRINARSQATKISQYRRTRIRITQSCGYYMNPHEINCTIFKRHYWRDQRRCSKHEVVPSEQLNIVRQGGGAQWRKNRRNVAS